TTTEYNIMKTITTLIDLLDLVPRGTEFAAFNLLQDLGEMTIQTPAGGMVTVTTKATIVVNGIDFTYTTTDSRVIVSDINNDIVGIATHDDHLTHISIDDSNGYMVNDLYEQTNEHVARYIASVSFN
ncbi:hypothetical protein OAO65_02110, partial [Flavobacteriales bacterium]|nr:hypothetical protein [Flavobacteriales bacterium]